MDIFCIFLSFKYPKVDFQRNEIILGYISNPNKHSIVFVHFFVFFLLKPGVSCALSSDNLITNLTNLSSQTNKILLGLLHTKVYDEFNIPELIIKKTTSHYLNRTPKKTKKITKT